MLKFGLSCTDLIFSVNGFEYRIYRDVEDDCVKNYHLVYFDGTQFDVPAITNTSPYEVLDQDEFYCHILDAMHAEQAVGCEFDQEAF